MPPPRSQGYAIFIHYMLSRSSLLSLRIRHRSRIKLGYLITCIQNIGGCRFQSSISSSTPRKWKYKCITGIFARLNCNLKISRNPRQTWEEYFFTTYGAQITELKFIQFNLYTEKALREFREMLSTSCPQLSILTLQFQKDPSSSSSYSGGGGSGTSSTSTPTPSPSPSPQMIPGAENVFFPTEESLRKTLVNLKKFTFTTDNKCFMNKNALEEFMALMPSLQEFTYRYTGAKKQWTLVRRVDIIDILCNIMKTGHYSRYGSNFFSDFA